MLKTVLFISVIFSSLYVKSQCSETLLPEATKKLDTFTYTKDFKIKLKEVVQSRDEKYVSVSVMLNKGTKYRFVLDDAKEYEGRLIFELFSDRGRQLSSYEPVVEKHYTVLEYTCNRSGMYFMNFEFKDAKEGCGVLVYGFKKI